MAVIQVFLKKSYNYNIMGAWASTAYTSFKYKRRQKAKQNKNKENIETKQKKTNTKTSE